MKRAHVTVIGDDKSGVIARICQFLFDAGGNIEELDQHVTEGLFTMHIEVSWPATGHTEEDIRTGLEALGPELGMDIRVRTAKEGPKRIALLVTKEEHAPRALLEAGLDAEIALMIGNHPDLAPLAKEFCVPFHHVDAADKKAHEAQVLALLEGADIDLVVLARYMRILSPNFVWRFPHRILNIHPSLLPAFPGAVPYRQALQRGVKVAGVTAHLVTTDLDQGPIVAQEAFPITDEDTLASVVAKGQALEGKTLVAAVEAWLSGLQVGWGRVASVLM
ncbi:MAG: formyltetrahydrofolate deformylase [Thermoplasmatota archaeon]